MADRIVEVRVGPEGEVIIEGHGFKGRGCTESAEFLVEALGSVRDSKKKAEWYLENSTSTRHLRRIGVDGRKLCG